jgi:hypothetical protein
MAASESEPNAERAPSTGPPGMFVDAELAERCAGFLEQVRKTVLRRQQSGLLHGGYEDESHLETRRSGLTTCRNDQDTPGQLPLGQ